jgi:hypothetical protein
MCCFAGHVSGVSGTDIFARVTDDREYIVYQMTFTAEDQTAMILPVPVAPGATEAAVTFVALDDYPEFFRDLEAEFKRIVAQLKLLGGSLQRDALTVQRVGAFEASFVPDLEQFDRLDPRFRIPRHVWKALPAYESFGFVVFKLQPGTHVNVHPLAFSFVTRDPATLFFPTLHIHDGTVHSAANFDHSFYTQNRPPESPLWPGGIWMPAGPARTYVDIPRARGLVEAQAPCFQSWLRGSWANKDILIPI